ncbi:transposase (plasmid) [Bacillus mycoides]|nr:transposase [Bacillus mycoides]
MLECHKKLRGIYGYRRIHMWLKATYNLHLNHKRIQRLMSELGIKSVIRKKTTLLRKKKRLMYFQRTI